MQSVIVQLEMSFNVHKINMVFEGINRSCYLFFHGGAFGQVQSISPAPIITIMMMHCWYTDGNNI